MRDTFRGGMCPVGCSECVVDIDVTVGGELLGELGVVGLFIRIEPAVLEQKDLTGLEGLDFLLHFGSDDIRSDLDGLSEKLLELLSNRNHGEVRILLSLRAAEVAHHDE